MEKTLVILDPTLKSGYTNIPNVVLTAPGLLFGSKRVIYNSVDELILIHEESKIRLYRESSRDLLLSLIFREPIKAQLSCREK